MQLRRRGQGRADRPRGLGPGADPDQPSPPGPGRPPRTRGGRAVTGAGDNQEHPSPPSATLPNRGPRMKGGGLERADRETGRQGGGLERADRGPWHPATQLEILHAAPAFAVVGVGLAFGLVAMRADPHWDRLALLAGLLICNQYAAGALNDAVDAEADAAADRGKPIQRGVDLPPGGGHGGRRRRGRLARLRPRPRPGHLRPGRGRAGLRLVLRPVAEGHRVQRRALRRRRADRPAVRLRRRRAVPGGAVVGLADRRPAGHRHPPGRRPARRGAGPGHRGPGTGHPARGRAGGRGRRRLLPGRRGHGPVVGAGGGGPSGGGGRGGPGRRSVGWPPCPPAPAAPAAAGSPTGWSWPAWPPSPSAGPAPSAPEPGPQPDHELRGASCGFRDAESGGLWTPVTSWAPRRITLQRSFRRP